MGNQTTTTSIVERLPRAEYGEMVRLAVVGEGQPDGRPIVAQALNISPSGILVNVPHPWAVGTEVQCSVPLPGGARTLRGRVARMHAQRESGGMGIQFVDLSDTATTLLSDIVAARQAQTRKVDVWFEGGRKASRLDATVTERGIKLTSPLPLLKLGSTIRFGFVGENKKSIAAGLLNGISVARGRRGQPASLELDITFVRPDAAAGELAPDLQVRAPQTGDPQARMKTEILPVRPTASDMVRRRKLLVSVGAITLGLAVLVVGLLAGVKWLFSGNAHPAAVAAAVEGPAAPTLPAAPARSPASTSALTPSERSASGPSAAKLARLAWQKNAPQLHVEGADGSLVIPTSGSFQDATYQLDDPHLLIINAPRAQPLVTAARYAFDRAGIASVKVVHKGAGSVFTVQFADPPPAVEQVRMKPSFIQIAVHDPSGR